MLIMLVMPIAIAEPSGPATISQATHARLFNTIAIHINEPRAIVNNSFCSIDTLSALTTPIIRNSRTLLPVRFISENLGASVEWDDATETVTVTQSDTTITLRIGHSSMTVNELRIILDVSPAIHNGRTFLPVRALAEALRKHVFYERDLVVLSDNPVLEVETDRELISEAIGWFKTGTMPVWEDDPKLVAERQAAARRLTAKAIIDQGAQYYGVRYEYGVGSGRTDVFDCASFVQFLYRKQGIKLPRRSTDQGDRGVLVSRDELETGDLLFFDFGSRGPGVADHVGIYVADDRILHSFPVRGVTLESMVWTNFIFAKRVIK